MFSALRNNAAIGYKGPVFWKVQAYNWKVLLTKLGTIGVSFTGKNTAW